MRVGWFIMNAAQLDIGGPHPASADLIERASALVKQYRECFWFWHPEAQVHNQDDVRLVVEHLREYGGWKAWQAAQELNQCLSRNSKNRS